MGKKFLAFVLSFVLIFAATACSNKADVNVNVCAANPDDKFLQTYDVSVAAGRKLKEKFDGYRKASVETEAFRNEYQGAQILIEPDGDVSSYDVSVTDLVCGENKIGKENISLYHEYYHYVESIYDTDSEMIPGMYPDALVPLEDAKRNGLNKIKGGQTQAVYLSLYVPKTAAAGTYTGTATVTADGKESNVGISVRVFDYTLSDELTFKSAVGLQRRYMFNGELDDSEEMYDKYVKRLRDYRLMANNLEVTSTADRETNQGAQYAFERKIAKTVEAAKDVRVSSYQISVYYVEGKYNDLGGIVDEAALLKDLQDYIDASVKNEVDLLKKAFVYVVDEPDLGSDTVIERAQYLNKQIIEVLERAKGYVNGLTAPDEMKKSLTESLVNLPNLVTSARSKTETSDNWGYKTCVPTIDKFRSSREIDLYRKLRETEGYSYWWYTCTVPKIPYPTAHIDDNGVSSRAMGWMANEYDVDGFLMWESVYYMSSTAVGQSESGTTATKGMDCYDNIHRWGDTYGDGFYFYPGKPLGIDGPVDSIRLHATRDGIEEYEAINDLKEAYEELGADASGVLENIFATMYGGVKVYCTSDELRAAHRMLGELLELAGKGIAVSDYTLANDGSVSAEITAPEGKTVSLNGTALEFAGGKAEASAKLTSFTLACDGTAVTLPTFAGCKTFDFVANGVTVFDAQQNPVENARIESVSLDGKQALKISAGSNVSRISIDVSKADIDFSSGTLMLDFYYGGEDDSSLAVAVQGSTKNRVADTLTIRRGWNRLRIDRLSDEDIGSVGRAKYLNLMLSLRGDAEIGIASVSVLK